MNIKLAYILLITLSIAYGDISQCKGKYYKDNTPNRVEKEICYSEYAIMYSLEKRTPLYTAEFLGSTPIMIRDNSFHEEPSLPIKNRATLNDYKGQKYDRGHLTPSADMTTSKAQYESFSLANMTPQVPHNNRVLWASVEKKVREIADKGGVYIITGCIYSNTKMDSLFIPSKFYKIVFNPKLEIGIVYMADNSLVDNLKEITIYELEQMTGISYFDIPKYKKKVLLEV